MASEESTSAEVIAGAISSADNGCLAIPAIIIAFFCMVALLAISSSLKKVADALLDIAGALSGAGVG